MLADRTQKPEKIQDTKKILKMEETNSIIGNPAFPLINENILFCLDHKSQMTFMQVCQSKARRIGADYVPGMLLPGSCNSLMSYLSHVAEGVGVLLLQVYGGCTGACRGFVVMPTLAWVW